MCPNAFPCLSTLRVDRCNLASLADCHRFLNLRKISASGNQIVNFTPFDLPLLANIDIDHNRLTSLSGFAQFQCLVRMNISGNPLPDDGFGLNSTFPDLKEFRADGSNISDPALIAAIAPNIVLISITFCQVSSLENVKLLASTAKSLASLDLRGNPLNTHFYPDLEGLAFGDSLLEYQSEESYDLDFPDSATGRAKYRKAIIRASSPSLIWLDGVKIPGRGPQPAVPPSKMNFDAADETPPSSDGTPLRPSVETEPPSPVSRSSSVPRSETASSVSRGELRQYLALTDDESDGADEEFGGREDNRSVVSSDSGPQVVDLERLGISRDSASVVSFDRFSAATDCGSELFHVFDLPHGVRGASEDERHKRGGCSFWVSMHKQEAMRRKPVPAQMAPVKGRPVMPQGGGCGRWPFNAKSERRLPWDTEPVKVEEPDWRKPPPRPKRARKR
jgi:hypothetical protein